MKKDITQPGKMAVPAGFVDALSVDHASIQLPAIVIRASKKKTADGDSRRQQSQIMALGK